MKHTSPPSQQGSIQAMFQPQAWIRDYAVDIDGKQLVDVTDAVLQLGLTSIKGLEDFQDSSDDLVCPEALGHLGPFNVQVTESICKFFNVIRLSDITQQDLDEALAAQRPVCNA